MGHGFSGNPKSVDFGSSDTEILVEKTTSPSQKEDLTDEDPAKIGGKHTSSTYVRKKIPKVFDGNLPPPPKKKNSPKAPEKTKPPVYPFIIIPNPQPQPPQPQGESITKRGDSGMKHPNTNSRRPARPGNTIPEAVKVGWKNPHLSL